MHSIQTLVQTGKALIRKLAMAALLAFFAWIFWRFATSTIDQYQQLAETLSPLAAIWQMLENAAPALLFWGGFWGIGLLIGHVARRRIYQPQAGDEVLYRNDWAGEPAIVIRGDRLFLFRGIRPDILKRDELLDCELREDTDGLVLRVSDSKGGVFNYHWNLEEGQVDVITLRQWIRDWLAGHTPSARMAQPTH